MKVLMINGSPRNEGNTTIALEEMRKVFEKNSGEVEIIQIGQMEIHGCISCNSVSYTHLTLPTIA